MNGAPDPYTVAHPDPGTTAVAMSPPADPDRGNCPRHDPVTANGGLSSPVIVLYA
jgi:hypothetical protein